MSDGALEKSGTFLHHNGSAAPAGNSVFELFSLRGKTAIITGAAAGIGYAAAEALAESGANVAICYNPNLKAHERAAAIEKKYKVLCKVPSPPACC